MVKFQQRYEKRHKDSEKLWAGGWLHTGDLATIDADGYVRIIDRLKDGIKSGGEWISSLQLEDLILRHPGVAEAAVVGVPDRIVLVEALPKTSVGKLDKKALRGRYAPEGVMTKAGPTAEASTRCERV
jgi:fatty-acyl-CoA synthase